MRCVIERSIWLNVTLVACGFLATAQAYAAPITTRPGQFVVTLAPSGEPHGAALASSDFTVLSNVPSPGPGPAITTIKRSGASLLSAGKEEVPVAADDFRFCDDLVKRGVATSCEPNYVYHATALPDDPKFGQLWGMSATNGIDAPRAWDLSTGSPDVVVAVIDTGADYTHEDLAANIWSNAGEIAGNGHDDDGDGYVDDVHGYNFASGNGNPMDDNGHGTHVAGTIGAIGNNTRGVVGVSWHVKILPIKFLSASGSGSLDAAVSAIRYMITLKQRGVNIVAANNSWGGGGASTTLLKAIQDARDAGIVFVAAAGNESNDNDQKPSYPASYAVSNVISVAALDSSQNLASFSNYGANNVGIAAPGVGILSTYPGNRYEALSGTSMATPHVTGAIALLKAYDPTLTMSDLIARVYSTGTSLSTLSGVVRGSRALNVGRMLANETSPLPTPTPAPNPCTYGITEIPFAPDQSAAEQPVVLAADEGQFYNLTLPFSFPFKNQQFSALTISPNGVLYFGRPPSTMDYLNSAKAPINSVALLHTDLFATGSPYGVRVSSSPEKVVIEYHVQHFYARSTSSWIEVVATLYPSGVIEEFVQFSNSAVQSVVQGQATIGVTGATSSDANTYAANSSKIKDKLSLRYIPQCDGSGETPGLSISALSAIAEIRPGVFSYNARPNNRLILRLSGSGSGAPQVGAVVNGRSCAQSTNVAMFSGEGSARGRLPRENIMNALLGSTVAFSSGGVSSAAPLKLIKLGISSRTLRSRAQRVSVRSINLFCAALMSSFTR